MKNNNVNSMTIVADNYPAKGHVKLVFVQQLVHAIIDTGIKVSVVAPQSVIHAIVHREKLLPIHTKGVTDRGVEYDIYRPYILSFGNNAYFESVARWYNQRSIISRVCKIDSDVLYAHFWSNALYLYKYALVKKLPLFVACGEGDDALEKMMIRVSPKVLATLKTSVFGVVSVSSENKRKCVKYGLVDDTDVETFPNGVDVGIFHQLDVTDMKKQLGIKEDDFVIAFVGSFTSRKGPDRVAKAITKLNDSQIKVMFIGNSFPGYAYDFDCPGIIYKGPLEHDLLPQYVNCADVFVLPTQKEGCCNAIVEALAMGVPVISSNGAFNDDILNEKNSIRIDPDNVDAIADAIKTLKNNTALRESMKEYSLLKHSEYAIAGRAKRIINFIEGQLDKRHK